jgi:hypothetical protein
VSAAPVGTDASDLTDGRPTSDDGPVWPTAAATGVGSLPGTDVRESLRVVLGELPDLPHLPELPARGAGADLVGRTLTLMPGIEAVTVPTGWRVAASGGADLRRGRAWFGEDLDVAEELATGWSGPFKVQVAGPLTVAASLELASGEPLLRDHAARRDVAQSLAEGVAEHVADVRRRVPGADVVLQFDEPSLPAVLAGRVPTASGYATVRSVDVAEARDLLRTAVDAATGAGAVAWAHSCAPDVPVQLLREAGFLGISLDASLMTSRSDDAIGEAVEAGVRMLLGVAPTDGSVKGAAGSSDPMGTVSPVVRWWQRLGFPVDELATRVVLTPACGLAGASPTFARDTMRLVREAAALLTDPPTAALQGDRS